jgi:hypothetical protein
MEYSDIPNPFGTEGPPFRFFNIKKAESLMFNGSAFIFL